MLDTVGQTYSKQFTGFLAKMLTLDELQRGVIGTLYFYFL